MTVWLFCPGDDDRKIAKALASDADVLILDWEDAVAADRKALARERTAAALHHARRARLFVRASERRGTAGEEDAELLAGLGVDGVMVPKCEHASDVTQFRGVGAPLVPLIESALGLEHISEIAGADPSVERLAFGCLDFCQDVRTVWSQDHALLVHARCRIVVAGRAAGLASPVDGVFPRLDDAGLLEETRSAKQLGFGGKMAIHPRQIAPIRQGFYPSEEELAWARSVLSDASGTGISAAVRAVGRDFVDAPVVETARQVIEMASRRREDT